MIHNVIVVGGQQYKAVKAHKDQEGFDTCEGCAFRLGELNKHNDRPCGSVCMGGDRVDKINVRYKPHTGKVRDPEILGWNNIRVYDD